MNLRFPWRRFCWSSVLLAVCGGLVHAEAPLNQRIDSLVGVGQAEFDKTAAAEAGDSEFLRRVYLDLIGIIPTTNEVRAFLADETTDKRAKLIDTLLASPQHARRMQYLFDATLMERRADKYVKSPAWQEYLRQSFLENKPWDQLVREILTADGSDPATRPAAKFLLDREMQIDEVTRDLGRIFLGRDMQCAQCHDHPNVDDYLQRHYHGLTAFLSRSYLHKDPKTKLASIGEKAEGQVTFTSVFTSEEGQTPPRMLDLPAIEDPKAGDEPYKVKPAKNVRSVPVYSRRLLLASAMTDSSNVAFRRNIANRLWAMMMGRGIVEPLDMWHADNPPSNAALIDLLADALQASGYDMTVLLRELALTKTYQRASQLPEAADPANQREFGVALLKPLSPEQLAWSMMQATGLTEQMMETLKAKQLKADAEKPENTKDDVTVDDPLWREVALHDALKSHVKTFVATFGVVGTQTSRFDASADQALFLRNGALLQSWIAPKGQNLTARLKSLETDQQVAEEFYLSLFSRLPTQEETELVAQFLAGSKEDRDVGLKQLVWAALSSDEFRFNH